MKKIVENTETEVEVLRNALNKALKYQYPENWFHSPRAYEEYLAAWKEIHEMALTSPFTDE